MTQARLVRFFKLNNRNLEFGDNQLFDCKRLNATLIRIQTQVDIQTVYNYIVFGNEIYKIEQINLYGDLSYIKLSYVGRYDFNYYFVAAVDTNNFGANGVDRDLLIKLFGDANEITRTTVAGYQPFIKLTYALDIPDNIKRFDDESLDYSNCYHTAGISDNFDVDASQLTTVKTRGRVFYLIIPQTTSITFICKDRTRNYSADQYRATLAYMSNNLLESAEIVLLKNGDIQYKNEATDLTFDDVDILPNSIAVDNNNSQVLAAIYNGSTIFGMPLISANCHNNSAIMPVVDVYKPSKISVPTQYNKITTGLYLFGTHYKAPIIDNSIIIKRTPRGMAICHSMLNRVFELIDTSLVINYNELNNYQAYKYGNLEAQQSLARDNFNAELDFKKTQQKIDLAQSINNQANNYVNGAASSALGAVTGNPAAVIGGAKQSGGAVSGLVNNITDFAQQQAANDFGQAMFNKLQQDTLDLINGATYESNSINGGLTLLDSIIDNGLFIQIETYDTSLYKAQLLRSYCIEHCMYNTKAPLTSAQYNYCKLISSNHDFSNSINLFLKLNETPSGQLLQPTITENVE